MSGAAAVMDKVPAHVPPELVWDKSYDDFTLEGDDPFLAVSRLHDGPPMVWSTNAQYGVPGWILTRNELITEAFIDHEHFMAERKDSSIGQLVGEDIKLIPIEIDPPAHFGYRRVVNPFLTPKAVSAFDDPVREVCNELIANFESKGGCEFVEDFAIPFPSYVFLDLMGMPRDRLDEFIGWEESLMRGADVNERVMAARSIYAYLKAHKDRQEQHPDNDFMRGLVTGMVGDRPLTHLEKMGIMYTFYVGGLDTVYSTLGWIMRHLATHPDLQEELRANPDKLPAAVEEFARAFSVVTTQRQVASDYEFHGVRLRKGDVVNMPLSLADRDPAVFDNPHEIDIDRKPRHINFGTGAHTCAGIHLAKRELRIVVEVFLERFRNIRIRAGETYRYHTGRTFGVDYLPLTWD
ncbi:MAG: cytochrome P450 [Novosphingobium sp.]|nr:cytochrome P450 [Novosphingobium sp.]